MNIRIPGIPIGKGRPRAFRMGSSVRLYTPKATAMWERVIATHAKAAMGYRDPLEGAISLDITFALPIPESWSKRRKAAPGEHISRPDLDNLLKAVLDGFNGIVFRDDSQITQLHANKVYAEEPGVFVMVERVEGELFLAGAA